MFRFAVETDEGGEVSRVLFLALRGDEGAVECFWPIPLDNADLSSGARRLAGLDAGAPARGA